METLQEKKSKLYRRGIIYAYAYLERRLEASGINKEGDFLPNGVEVLKHKLSDIAEAIHDHDHEEIVTLTNLSFCMASLAGEPGKEILVVGSPGCAAYMSWCVLKYLGWSMKEEKAEDARNKKKKARHFLKWHKVVTTIEPKLGVNGKYLDLMRKYWKRDDNVVDHELSVIERKHGNEKWFKRYRPPTDDQ